MTRTYQLNERKLRFFPYWYIWKNCNSCCELCLAWCGRKLLSSNKIAEFLENWKINFTLLWYRAKEGEMWYALQWYQVLEPRLHLMYIQYKYTWSLPKKSSSRKKVYQQVENFKKSLSEKISVLLFLKYIQFLTPFYCTTHLL